MKQESAFDLGALSSTGAVGLMQIMPATAVATEPGVLRVELVREADNARVGTKYLSQMYRKFRGNFILATAAYNAGPTAVDRWIKEFGLKDNSGRPSMSALAFIESIPYK